MLKVLAKVLEFKLKKNTNKTKTMVIDTIKEEVKANIKIGNSFRSEQGILLPRKYNHS